MTGGKSSVRIVLAGGGTGGHVYPVLEIHRLLREALGPGETLYLGTRGRAEELIVPRFSIPIHFVPSAPVSGVGPLGLVRAAAKITVGTALAKWELLRFRPDLVLASGGYASAPACLAAFLLRPILGAPLVIHEQNVVPGLMNRLGARIADLLMASFPETAAQLPPGRCVVTGYPVRAEVLAARDRDTCRATLGLPIGSPVLLVFGGSMGSRSLNRLMAAALPGLLRLPDGLTVVHAAGMGGGEYWAWEETTADLAAASPPGTIWEREGEGLTARFPGGVTYRLRPYLHDLPDHLAAADLVVCRGGAGTVSEIAAAGRAAIVVPKRGLPGNHQEANAAALAARGACEVLLEHPLPDGTDGVDTGAFLGAAARLLADPARRRTLEEGAKGAFVAGADLRIVEAVQGVLGRRG